MRQVLFIILLLLFGLSDRSLALRWDGPKATGLIDLGGVFGPEPTAPPDLAKRQDVHSPHFCGFGNASSGITWECGDTAHTCILQTDLSVQGCCNTVTPGATCDLHTKCQNDYSKTVPNTDFLMLLCRDQSLTCATVTFTDDYLSYLCVTDLSDVPATIERTYSNQPEDALTVEYQKAGNRELIDPERTTAPSKSSSASPSKTSQLVTSSSPTPPAETSKPPSAIAGANKGTVIGVSIGAALAGMIVTAIIGIWYMRKRRKIRRRELANNRRGAAAYTGITSPPPEVSYELQALPLPQSSEARDTSVVYSAPQSPKPEPQIIVTPARVQSPELFLPDQHQENAFESESHPARPLLGHHPRTSSMSEMTSVLADLDAPEDDEEPPREFSETPQSPLGVSHGQTRYMGGGI